MTSAQLLIGGRKKLWFECRSSRLVGIPGGTSGKEPPAGDRGDEGSIPVLGRSPRGGHGNPLQYTFSTLQYTHSRILQYSFLEDPMDRKPGGLQSVRSQRTGHDLSNFYAHMLSDSCALTFKPCFHSLIPPLLSGRIFFLSRHPSFLNTFLHLDQPCPRLRSRATRGWSLPELAQVSLCDTLQGAEWGPTRELPCMQRACHSDLGKGSHRISASSRVLQNCTSSSLHQSGDGSPPLPQNNHTHTHTHTLT